VGYIRCELETWKLVALQLQTGFTQPRRADARRSCERAYVHRKNRFSPANTRTVTRAGGVSPPWGTFDANSKPGNWSHCNCRRGLPSHGGLTPAAPVNVRSSVAERCSILRCSVGITNHGGLTPAALDRMCVCASQKSLFAGRRSHCNTRAGGVSPP
jgi:hypothetical protein